MKESRTTSIGACSVVWPVPVPVAGGEAAGGEAAAAAAAGDAGAAAAAVSLGDAGWLMVSAGWLHKMLKVREKEEKGGVSRVRLPRGVTGGRGIRGVYRFQCGAGAASAGAGREPRGAECNRQQPMRFCTKPSAHLVIRQRPCGNMHGVPCGRHFTPPTANQATREARVASPAWGAHEGAGRAGVMVAGRGNPPAASLLAGSSSAPFVERHRVLPFLVYLSSSTRNRTHIVLSGRRAPLCVLAPDPGL